MVDLIAAALALQEFLDSHRWRFCFIGGLAVHHQGEPRLTRDLDLSLLTGFGGEEVFIDTLLAHYPARLRQAREFALARRVLLLRSGGGVRLDISLAALPCEQTAIDRSVPVEMLPGAALRLCAPEDLVIMKVFAGREIDWRDARSVLVRQSALPLDWDCMETHLAALADLKGEPEMLARCAARRLRP